MSEIIDILEATDEEWAKHLAKLPNRLVRCFGRVWEIVDGEPAVRIAYAVRDDEFFDAIFSMIYTPDPSIAMHRDDVSVPITYDMVRPSTAVYVDERCRELEAADRMGEINLRSWFKALAIMSNTSSTGILRLRTRAAQVANGRPTTPS